jgi:NAD(P)-dependent dehydrogenase (short-subunit alcohol dehydrogenase family)
MTESEYQTNSTVLVTGASKGIGRAVATEFARRGYRVAATARDPRTLDDLDVAHRLRLDVTDQASIDAAVAEVGDVDVLVSNAGNIFLAAVEASPAAEMERLFAQNTVGAMRVAQAVLPGMRARGTGRLLFMSSVVSRVIFPAGAAYAATKWALEALVEGLAIETAPFGLHATLLQPGAVDSGALDDPLRYQLQDDPYASLLVGRGEGAGAGALTPHEVAVATADTAELAHPPLRVPIGSQSSSLLAARHDAPDDIPFIVGG